MHHKMTLINPTPNVNVVFATMAVQMDDAYYSYKDKIPKLYLYKLNLTVQKLSHVKAATICRTRSDSDMQCFLILMPRCGLISNEYDDDFA